MVAGGDEIALVLDGLPTALADRLAALLDGVDGVRLVASPGEADAVVGLPPDAPAWDPALSPREAEVLVLLAEGASNRGIAERLGISVHTAKFHVGTILDKLDAAGRTDAVAQAARIGVLRL